MGYSFLFTAKGWSSGSIYNWICNIYHYYISKNKISRSLEVKKYILLFFKRHTLYLTGIIFPRGLLNKQFEDKGEVAQLYFHLYIILFCFNSVRACEFRDLNSQRCLAAFLALGRVMVLLSLLGQFTCFKLSMKREQAERRGLSQPLYRSSTEFIRGKSVCPDEFGLWKFNSFCIQDWQPDKYSCSH